VTLLKVTQAAVRLGVSVSTLYQLAAARKIPHFRVGTGRGGIRFSEEQITCYLNRCRVDIAPAINSQPTIRPRQLKLKHVSLARAGSRAPDIDEHSASPAWRGRNVPQEQPR
jgi:excisionase family DNA binding protein